MSRLPNFLENRLTDVLRLSAPWAIHPLPPGRFLVLISVRGWVDPRATVQLEGLGQLKNPITSSGIESSIQSYSQKTVSPRSSSFSLFQVPIFQKVSPSKICMHFLSLQPTYMPAHCTLLCFYKQYISINLSVSILSLFLELNGP
jgi:hypothetical protein